MYDAAPVSYIQNDCVKIKQDFFFFFFKSTDNTPTQARNVPKRTVLLGGKNVYIAEIYIKAMTDVFMDVCYQCAGLETVLLKGKSKPAKSQTNNLT